MILDKSKCKPLSIITFDPGKITGVAYFEKGELTYHKAYQEDCLSDVFFMPPLMEGRKDITVIIESFRLYSHKVESLTNDDLLTPQIIGRLKEWFKDFPIIMQSAAQAKGFFTNQRLKEMDLYVKNRHCRDAVRHGLYGLYFNKEVK